MKFLNPIYLVGLILVAVPIILHLYFRKRLKKIPFSSLMFLRSAEASRLRWLRLREILILIMRCIMVAGIFVALARPQYQGKIFGANRLGAVFLVVDNSPSMYYGNNFEIALQQAEKIISAYSPKSMFYVVPMCFQKDFEPLWTNKSSALKALKEIKIQFTAHSLKDLYEKFLQEQTNLPKDFIYIGDGQTINFRGIESTVNFHWLRIPIGSNICVDKVSLKNTFMLSAENYELNVSIMNYSNRTYQGKIKLVAGDFFREQNCVNEPGQISTTTFIIPSNVRKGIVKIDGDSLDIDNQYFFSKSLQSAIKILIVGNNDYLSLGLRPSATIKTPFDVTTVSSLRTIDLRNFQLVILNGIEEISEFELLKLNNFLTEKRNAAIVFLTSRTASNLSKLLSVCGTAEDWIEFEGYLTIKWFDKDYKPLQIFANIPGLKTIKFFNIRRFVPRAQILAKLDNGLPLIVKSEKLMVVATEFNKYNTDIIYNANFVPLLHALIYGLINSAIDNEFLAGEKLLKPGLVRGISGEIVTEDFFPKPGFYVVGEETLAVNTDPQESNPATITAEAAKTTGIKAITAEALAGGADLTTLFLIIMLCALLFELLLLLL